MNPYQLFQVLFTLVILAACGPDAAGGGATPESATVAVMGEAVDDDTGAVLHPPECMGMAVAPTAVLTGNDCPPNSSGVFLFVDAVTWRRTSSGVALADLAFDVGEVRTLVPRQPLLNWVVPALPVDGPAVFVALRGTDFTTVDTVLAGNHMTGAVEHGDSGAGVFQGGRLVGLVQACTAPDDVTCIGGGRFSRVP